MTSLKNLNQLTVEINQAVHEDGPLGKTTAPGLNAVLQSLATELTTLPQVVGAGGVQSLTYAEAWAQQAAGRFQPGAYYLIGQRPMPTLGSSGEVLVQATATNALAPEAVLCTRVPDYARVPLWRTNYFEQGATLGTTYVQTDEPFIALTPAVTDFVDYSLASISDTNDDTTVTAQLPFPFVYGGVTYTQVALDTNGRLVLDPDYFRSDYRQHDLAPGYASIYLCWGDLIVTSGTVRYYLTGQAPYRKFVVEYTNALPQTGFPYFSFSGIFSGQIVLEETTNAVTLGLSANTLTDTTWVQGLQYPQQAYQVDKGSVLHSGVRHRFTPITSRDTVIPTLAVGSPVRWLGQTWHMVVGGNANEEPGTSSAWELAAGPETDTFGNPVPAYHRITYDLGTDGIDQRCDNQNNIVITSSLGGFPWGAPGVRNNYLRDVSLDNSLHYVQDLQLSGNALISVSLHNVALAGVACTDNRLTDVALRDYAPTAFAQVDATHGLDPAYTHCVGQHFWNGRLVEDAGIVAADMMANVSHRQEQLSCLIYKDGKVISNRVPDIMHPVGSVVPDHDHIDLLGDWSKQSLWLRNYDFTINGNNTLVRSVAVGRGSTGMSVSLADLVVATDVDFNVTSPLTSSLNLNPRADPTAGMHITLTRCTIARLALAPGASSTGVGMNYYTLSYCAIGQITRTAAGAGTRHRFDHCTFGQGLTAGAVFSGGAPDTAQSLVIANSVIYLNGTATLYPNNTPPVQLPTFQNVTVVAADGMVSQLGAIDAATPAAGVEIAASPVLFVQGYGQTLPGQRGNVARPFATIQSAIDAAADYDTIVVLPGGTALDTTGRHCYDEAVNVTKSVTIAAVGTVVCTGAWILPQYPYADRGYTHVLKGIIFRNYVAMVVPRGGTLDVRFEDCLWEEGGYIFSLQGITTTPQVGADIATFVRCRFNTTLPAGSPGPFKFQGRDDAGYVKDVSFYLKDCEVTTANTPIATGYASVRQRIVLQGTTILTPGVGQPLIGTTRVNSSVPLTFGELFVDERPSAAGGATTAGLEVLAVATLNGNLSASGFNTLPIDSTSLDVRPAGTPGGWDVANNAYLAPLSGTYELLAKARISDSDGPVGGSYALGAGPINVDGAWVAWNTIAQTTFTNRKGHQNTRILHLNAGDAVRMYLYLDSFSANVGGELSIKLLRRD